jgi:predicted ATPase
VVTLTGAGGCGKTRLALQAAADALDRHPDGAWWVELAALHDGARVADMLCAAIGVTPLPGVAPLEAAVSYLQPRRAIVVLDNCEHLLAACAEVVEGLVRACPALTLLATSRAPLGVEGEQAWRVPSLSLPPERAELIDALDQGDAVRLFIARARQVRPNFAVSADNAPALAQICHDLDGIPLAIELAAARVRVLSVEQIAAAVTDRFRLLTGSTRGVLPRQRTLRASVDWSHDLLTDDERVLLRRLGVFVGGWTLEACEQVCADEQVPRLEVLDLLTALVDRSLVQADDALGAVRYRCLETVRQYALERLAEAGETPALRDRHRDVFVAFAEQVAPHLVASDQERWLDRLDAESANLAAALDHALASAPESALRLCVAQAIQWRLRGRFVEAESACARALDADDVSPLRARVLWVRGYLGTFAGALEASVAHGEQALALAREQGVTRRRLGRWTCSRCSMCSQVTRRRRWPSQTRRLRSRGMPETTGAL